MSAPVEPAPGALARALSCSPLLVGLASAAYAIFDHSLHVLLAVPIAVAVQAALMAADKRRIAAAPGCGGCAAVAGRAWSCIPAVHLWRSAAGSGGREKRGLARQWIVSTAFGTVIFALAVRLATLGPDGGRRCPTGFAAGGLASVYGAMMAGHGPATGGCTGWLHGGSATGGGVTYVVERRGDEVLLDMRLAAAR